MRSGTPPPWRIESRIINTMAKKKNQKKAAPTKKRQRQATALAGIDEGARRFRQMLLDPCNSPMCAPTYTGGHSGNYRRIRRIFNIGATEVEGIYVFQLGTNMMLLGGHSAPNAGTNITLTNDALFYANGAVGIDSAGTEIRALAGCVKVRYTGAESARAGVIGMATGQVMGMPGAIVGADNYVSFSPVVGRVGESLHEAKFVPLAGDEEFAEPRVSGGSSTWLKNKSCIAVAFRGVPAGSIQFEITAVLELDSSNTGSNSAGFVASSIAPSSSNTLSQVLRSLGPVSNWAFNHVVVPTIRGVASGVARTMANSAPFASAGMAMLTL